jgi:glycosyltransferase involved in cell wall biosynthesis
LKRIVICGAIYDTPSGPSGQSGKLYTALKEEGYTVFKKSRFKNKILRPLDILFFIIFNHKKYDIIIMQVASYKAFIINVLTVFVGRILKKQTIALIEGGAFVEFYSKYPRFVFPILNKANILLSPSNFITNFLNDKNLKVTYLPNFIDIQKFAFIWKPNNEIKLLWVRAFNDVYKPEMAINAVHKLKTMFPEITLTMVGPDLGKLKHCKHLIKSLQLTHQITITGPISNNHLNSIYGNHTIYLNTTSYESFGVALVEAACSGIPIVTTNVGEIPYNWIHREELLMVEDNNLEDFVSRILALLKDRDLQLKLSQNARNKAEKFDWDHVKNTWYQLLN